MKFLFQTIFFITFFISNSNAEVVFDRDDEFTDQGLEKLTDNPSISVNIEKSRIVPIDGKSQVIIWYDLRYKIGAIHLQNYYNDWNERNQWEGYVILDGERWNKHFDFTISTGMTKGGEAIEQYNFSYYDSDFKKIIQSSSFRAKVGDLVFEIDLSKLPMSEFSLSSLN